MLISANNVNNLIYDIAETITGMILSSSLQIIATNYDFEKQHKVKHRQLAK